MAKTSGSTRSASKAPSGGSSLSSVESRIAKQKFESAALYVNGKQVFFKDGAKSYVTFTPSEVGKMRGGVLTHNHPGGRSFSKADVAILGRGLREIRAVSSEYLYSLKNEKGVTISSIRAKRIYKKHEKVITELFTSKINSGEMNPDFANKNHHHEVMIRVAKDLGLEYKRTKR